MSLSAASSFSIGTLWAGCAIEIHILLCTHMPHMLTNVCLRCVVGRCLGKITKRNMIPQVNKVLADGSRQKINFYVYYEIDQEEVKTLLLTDWYDGDDEG